MHRELRGLPARPAVVCGPYRPGRPYAWPRRARAISRPDRALRSAAGEALERPQTARAVKILKAVSGPQEDVDPHHSDRGLCGIADRREPLMQLCPRRLRIATCPVSRCCSWRRRFIVTRRCADRAGGILIVAKNTNNLLLDFASQPGDGLHVSLGRQNLAREPSRLIAAIPIARWAATASPMHPTHGPATNGRRPAWLPRPL